MGNNQINNGKSDVEAAGSKKDTKQVESSANATSGNSNAQNAQTLDNQQMDDFEEGFTPPPLPWGYRFFHLWLPRLHMVSAWTMLVMNLVLPGIGTMLFSFKWLGFSDYAFNAPLSIRYKIFSISFLCGAVQLIFTPIILGWGFALLTGLMAVQQAYWIAAFEEDEEDWEEQKTSDVKTGPSGANSNQSATGGQEQQQKRQRKQDLAPLPGRVHMPKRKYKVPPGWVYRLYPGFIDPPSPEEQRGNRNASRTGTAPKSEGPKSKVTDNKK